MPLEWILSYVTESDDGCGITNQNHCSSHLGIWANENKPLHVYEMQHNDNYIT